MSAPDTQDAELFAYIDEVAHCAAGFDKFSQIYAGPVIRKIAKDKLARATGQPRPSDVKPPEEEFGAYLQVAIYFWRKAFPTACQWLMTEREITVAKARLGAALWKIYGPDVERQIEEEKAVRPRIAVFLEGGAVKAVECDIPGGARYVVIDYDTDDASPVHCISVGQTDAEGNAAGSVACIASTEENTGHDSTLLGFAFTAARRMQERKL